jgi:hypothetical protein
MRSCFLAVGQMPCFAFEARGDGSLRSFAGTTADYDPNFACNNENSRSGLNSHVVKRMPVAFASALPSAAATDYRGFRAHRSRRIRGVGEIDFGARDVGERRQAEWVTICGALPESA